MPSIWVLIILILQICMKKDLTKYWLVRPCCQKGQPASSQQRLATNGAKHGALSVPDGRIFVRWQRRVNGNADAPVVLEWQETGGPTVQPPDTTGYGMEVIRDLIPYELGGRVDLTFPADGLCCRLEIPAKGATYPETKMTRGLAREALR